VDPRITGEPQEAVSNIQQPKSPDQAQFGRKFAQQRRTDPFKARGDNLAQNFKDLDAATPKIAGESKEAVSNVQQPKSPDPASQFGRKFAQQPQTNPFKASGIDLVQNFKDLKNQKASE
jgi:hypothetical protein